MAYDPRVVDGLHRQFDLVGTRRWRGRIRRLERPGNERWRHNLIGALRKDPRA